VRRDDDDGLAGEIDDIRSLFNYLDEHKAFNMLPTYVSSSPDKILGIRL